jgi:hypothetical protein
MCQMSGINSVGGIEALDTLTMLTMRRAQRLLHLSVIHYLNIEITLYIHIP